MKRTQIQDFEKIEQAKDLEDLVKDKRVESRKKQHWLRRFDPTIIPFFAPTPNPQEH
jgi:hypothetical protein